jgi:PAS domain S-box-containing protein
MDNENDFRLMVELSPNAIAIICQDEIVYVNPAGLILFGGKEAEDLLGKSLWTFIHPRYKPIIEKRNKQMMDEGTRTPPLEIKLHRSDGDIVEVEMLMNPLIFNGHPAIQVIFNDITTRKYIEDQIRQRNIELSAMNAIAATVSQTLDLKTLLEDALDDVLQLELLGGNAQGMIFLVDDGSDLLSLVAHRGAHPNHPCLKQPPRIGECLCGLAVQLGETVISKDCFHDERHTRSWAEMPEHKDVSLPLKAHGNILGAMDVRLPAEKEIGENVVGLLAAVADQISVAIENARLFQEVQQQNERLRSLSARLVEAEDNERKRLSRELHDRVGEGLTALGINLNIIRKQLPERSLESVQRYLDDCIALVEQTTDRIRDVMAELRPPMLDDYGLVATLGWYAEQFSARVGVDMRVIGHEPTPRLPSSVENALFRIAIEALTNIVKHAQASHVTIKVDFDDQFLRLEIADDGVGFDTSHPFGHDQERGWGLLTMSERAEAVGGRWSIESSLETGGTCVIAEVPR